MREPAGLAELDPVNGTWRKGRNASVSEGRWAKLAARAVTDRALTATYVRVLAFLAIHADRLGVAWPSQETIAAALGINRATVCRAIKRLCDLGYVDRYRKRTPRGHFRNVYRLLYPAYMPLHAEGTRPEM
jgi:DNA-binding MarR family transcriptional regulator